MAAGKVQDFAYVPTFRVGPVQFVKFHGINFTKDSVVTEIKDNSAQYEWTIIDCKVHVPSKITIRAKVKSLHNKAIHHDLHGIGDLTVTVKTGIDEVPTDLGEVNYQE